MRELQRVTGSVIKLPEHALAPPSGGDEETPVHIIGAFYSVQVSSIYTQFHISRTHSLYTLFALSLSFDSPLSVEFAP